MKREKIFIRIKYETGLESPELTVSIFSCILPRDTGNKNKKQGKIKFKIKNKAAGKKLEYRYIVILKCADHRTIISNINEMIPDSLAE